MRTFGLFALALLAPLASGCGSSAHDHEASSESEPFTSDVATLLDLELDGELTTSNGANLAAQAKTQLFYAVGQLNAAQGVARLSRLVVSNVTTTSLGGGLLRVRYHAKLPIVWGAKKNLPSSVSLTPPRRVDAAGISAFAAKYAASCQEHDGHDVTAANFWFHYRPAAAGCALASSDVVAIAAKATVSTKNTSGKYPEYDRVWEDGALNVVAVFGKYEAGATSDADAGVAAFDAFVSRLSSTFPAAATTPAALPASPGATLHEVTFEQAAPNGRTITVTALLVDELASASPAWDKRYAELTPGADLIIYNGHAGLGANVRALANKGKWFPGKYQILFVNGCDTFAYQDDTLATTRAALNPDDPSGTRYLDTITNAMPAFFSSMPDGAMSLVNALAGAQPRPYESIFKDIDAAQVVVMDGEQDNLFTPAASTVAPAFEESGTVAYKEVLSWQTSTLPAGHWVFEMTPEASAPNGDADLRVRVGAAPDGTQTYKCKSYVANSNERCALTLAAPSTVWITATGDRASQSSSFTIRGFAGKLARGRGTLSALQTTIEDRSPQLRRHVLGRRAPPFRSLSAKWLDLERL